MRGALPAGVSWQRLVVLVVVLAIALIPAAGFNNYVLHLVVIGGIWALFTTSLNVIVGYTGPHSFAHGALFGIGAYLTAIGTVELSLPIWAALALGGVAAAFAGLFIALPSLRLKGIYFAIVTLAFQLIYEDAVILFDEYTGGLIGFINIPSFDPLFGLSGTDTGYYLILLVVGASLLGLYRTVNSPLGDVFRIIKQDEELAAQLGYRTTRFKITSFVISSLFAGVAGGLLAVHNNFIGPTSSDVFASFQAYIYLIAGGAGTFVGPIVASSALIVVKEFLGLSGGNFRLLNGVLLFVVVFWLPDGIAGIDWRAYRAAIAGWWNGD